MAVYSLGIDVGRKNDRTAWVITRRDRSAGGLPRNDAYSVVYASARQGISAQGIVDRTVALVTQLDRTLPRHDRIVVSIDMSGLGWGVAEALRTALRNAVLGRPVRLWAVNFTDGYKVNKADDFNKTGQVNVGRSHLTETTAQGLLSGRLRLTDDDANPLPIEGDAVDLLHEEIGQLSVKTTGRKSRIDHPGGKHDDTWMALCLAFVRATEEGTGGYVSVGSAVPDQQPTGAAQSAAGTPSPSTERKPSAIASPDMRPRNAAPAVAMASSQSRRKRLGDMRFKIY